MYFLSDESNEDTCIIRHTIRCSYETAQLWHTTWHRTAVTALIIIILYIIRVQSYIWPYTQRRETFFLDVTQVIYSCICVIS